MREGRDLWAGWMRSFVLRAHSFYKARSSPGEEEGSEGDWLEFGQEENICRSCGFRWALLLWEEDCAWKLRSGHSSNLPPGNNELFKFTANNLAGIELTPPLREGARLELRSSGGALGLPPRRRLLAAPRTSRTSHSTRCLAASKQSASAGAGSNCPSVHDEAPHAQTGRSEGLHLLPG